MRDALQEGQRVFTSGHILAISFAISCFISLYIYRSRSREKEEEEKERKKKKYSRD